MNDWQWDSAVAGLFLPSEQLMVQRAYPGGGDKHCGPAMMPDVLSTLYCQQQQSTHTRLAARRVFTFGVRCSAINASAACSCPPTLSTTTRFYSPIQHLKPVFLTRRKEKLSVEWHNSTYPCCSFPHFRNLHQVSATVLTRIWQMGHYYQDKMACNLRNVSKKSIRVEKQVEFSDISRLF